MLGLIIEWVHKFLKYIFLEKIREKGAPFAWITKGRRSSQQPHVLCFCNGKRDCPFVSKTGCWGVFYSHFNVSDCGVEYRTWCVGGIIFGRSEPDVPSNCSLAWPCCRRHDKRQSCRRVLAQGPFQCAYLGTVFLGAHGADVWRRCPDFATKVSLRSITVHEFWSCEFQLWAPPCITS